MKYVISIILIALLSSCGTFFDIDRKEKDVFVVTTQDTTYVNFNESSTKNTDRGVLLPSDREILTERYVTSSDSVIKRSYPNFIRLGLFESAGLITNGNSENSISGGPVGVHIDPSINIEFRGKNGPLFGGGLYRVGIIEKRLRWFNDAENWTWGLHGFEMIMPDARAEESLMGVLPFYVRKRWFLSDDIPYNVATLHIGVGWLGLLSETLGYGLGGSGYLNIAGSYDIGSIGGFNARAYLGIAAGYNGQYNPLIVGNEYLQDDNGVQIKNSTSPVILYGGLGVSLLDFLNTVEETKQEFKEMKHSAWDIGLVQLAGINAFTDKSIFLSDDDLNSGTTDNQLVTGLAVRLINTSVGLPILNNRIWAGTSLLNIFYAGGIEGGVGILPIRLGYWQPLIKDELSIDPFIEYNYFPSTFIHLGARISIVLPDFRNHQFGIQFGYANGNPIGGLGGLRNSEVGGLLENYTKINNFYLGFYFGLWDRVFYEKEIRYFKD
ncbi:hypothetical protein OAQ99_00775 [Candidatus Kapabacteria bacterium]|nr:hypothetical protein [Candidatus Kapabacteria bacterium]